MRAHYLQHVPFEGLGSIESWLKKSGYAVTNSRLFQPVKLPDVNEIDLLIVMGGPMSVNNEGDYSWLVPEKKFIRCAIEAGKSVLGICLGAQLIASALGARVYPNQHKEIGWFPVQAIPSSNKSQFCFPLSMDVFHWHGETFDLPSGAIHLAKSEACRNQAFQIGNSTIGLQFHLETTPESASELVSHCRDELIPAQYVQTERGILSVSPERYQSINKMMNNVLAFLQQKNR
jgi:GMP synthase-like glutamine amidotransferase